MSWNRLPFAALVPLACLFVQPAAAETASPITPAVYELAGANLRVTYVPSGADGQPHLTLLGPEGTLDFSGTGVRTVSTPDLGTLVSVTVLLTVDTGSISFTLVVPPVVLAPGATQTPVAMQGITTVHRFSIMRQLDYGQLSTSSQVMLVGVARAGGPEVAKGLQQSEVK